MANMPNPLNTREPTPEAPTRLCECGNACDSGRKTCATCVWLDGATASEQRIITALRALGGVGTRAILAREAAVSERTFWRVIARLRDRGRVVARDAGDSAFLFSLRSE